MNILDFLPAGLKHKGGGEWAGPCPKCGGKDRFVAWPEHPSGASGGKYLCRGCAPEGGDCIQFLRDFHGMSYPEACEALRIEPRHNTTSRPTKKPGWEPETERQPSGQWQRRAATFLDECRKHLETEAARSALQGRGLNMEFALLHGVGWNPADRYEAPESWGLDPWTNSRGNPGKVYVPAGLVVVTFRRPGPVAVKIRRSNWTAADKWPKYHMLKGSGNGAFILGKAGLPVVVVESELDALLIAQEAPDICTAMAIGSASNRPHTAAADFLRNSDGILVALDFDEPDAKGQRAGTKAWVWWRENFSNARRWPPATGKDPGEMHKAGVSVRLWIEAGIREIRKRSSDNEWFGYCPNYYEGCAACASYYEVADWPGREVGQFCRKYDWDGALL
jgi:hypothetical protein